MDDNFRTNNLAYCQVITVTIYDWLEETVINSRRKTTDSFVLTDVKNKFPTISPQLLEMTLQILLSTGKISLYSPDAKNASTLDGGSHRSRVTLYYLSTDSAAEIIEKKEKQERLAELAEQYQAEIDRQNRRKAQREVQDREAEAQEVSRTKSSSSKTRVDNSMNEKENSQNKEHLKKARVGAITGIPPSPALAPAPAPFVDSPLRAFKDTRSLPVCDVSPRVIEDVTEILQMSSENSEGGGVEIGAIFEQIQSRDISREVFYKSLEYLTQLNRIMVDWDDNDKDQKSTIYLI